MQRPRRARRLQRNDRETGPWVLSPSYSLSIEIRCGKIACASTTFLVLTGHNLIEGFDQTFQLPGGETAELALVQLANGLVELAQRRQALGSDARLDDAAVVFLALTGD